MLKAGSIISMGTPGGVAIGMNPPKFLRSGDEVVCEIEKIGVLRNIVK
jgi:2-keto-4-pentenoate hydratase/2-oxohepta-3-ene-1,7-dioic acid hydratase in catechol pathway